MLRNDALQAFMSKLPDEIDAAFISDTANRKYLTGFISTAGALFVTKQAAYFIVDGRYFQLAKDNVIGCTVVQESNLELQLCKLITKHNVKQIGIEVSKLPIAKALALQAKLAPTKILFTSEMEQSLQKIREIKTQSEIYAIRTAQAIACAAFEHMLNFARPGVQELELAAELGTFAARHGCQRRAFSMIFTSGKKTAFPHGSPPSRALEFKDIVMVDMSCMYNGFFSDMTRTFCIGGAGEKEQSVYKIVYAAQQKAIESIKPGIACSEIDKCARQIISDAGYGEFFSHNLGHGIGSETHEQPVFASHCDTLLQPGHVLSVEPGIYIPNEFGVRIEDLIAVTCTGIEPISFSPQEILVV